MKIEVKLNTDVKMIPIEKCLTQHELLVCQARVKNKNRCKKFVPKRRLWKLQQVTSSIHLCHCKLQYIERSRGLKVSSGAVVHIFTWSLKC